MATTFKWATAETPQTYLTTTLNSLAHASFAGAGSAVTNATDLYALIAVELSLAALSPGAGAWAEIWIYYALDGSTYATAAKPLITSALLTVFGLDTTASTAQRLVRSGLPIAPFNFQLDVRNAAGVAFAASGNTLKFARYNDQAV